MEARSRSSRDLVMPLTLSLQRSHSPTRHFNSPSSSSSAFNFPVHTFSGISSYSSSASASASSSIDFPLGRSESRARSAGRPISPKGGAALKAIPCATPRKTCMCSPTNHPVECKKVCDDEFFGKNRRCGRRMGEKSPHGSHTPLQPPHEKEKVFPAQGQQALPYDQGSRSLLSLASGRLRFKIQLRLLSLNVPLTADEESTGRSACIVAE